MGPTKIDPEMLCRLPRLMAEIIVYHLTQESPTPADGRDYCSPLDSRACSRGMLGMIGTGGPQAARISAQ
ncbi:hypothetical protein RRG08_002869 [Elysia crispata]|uniref:Uncharacterized protein n=1 Tax=Elysia crispata TaxID=231223 RepID=A0AAE1CMH0_9GAST|nr:hypothetical protein RRG08_002869 [Elysia crispata]